MLRVVRQIGLPLFIAMLIIPLINACGKASYYKKGERRIERRMLVTAYDPGQKSTGWKHPWGCCLLPPVYAYGPSEGKRKQVGITSDGTKAKKGVIAADIRHYPYGTQMFVPGYGWGEVHDIGSAIKDDHIDVFFPTEKEAKAWGQQHLNVIIILK